MMAILIELKKNFFIVNKLFFNILTDSNTWVKKVTWLQFSLGTDISISKGVIRIYARSLLLFLFGTWTLQI